MGKAEKLNATNLTISIETTEGIDSGRLDRMSRLLRNEIRELDIESVELARGGNIPRGSKAGDALTLGTLVVTLLPAIIPQLVALLQTWISRGENRVLKIKTEDFEVEIPQNLTPQKAQEFIDLVTQKLAR